MKQVNNQQEVIRFGVFEADLRTGELRRKGRLVRLQEQPFQVLALLLARPGELVTREELRQTLWPADTFVDFEHGLNKAISKLRDALADNSRTPRYIETLPRRGYRFIAPLTIATPPLKSAETPRESGDRPDLPATTSPPKIQWKTYATVVSLGVLVLLGSWLVFHLARRHGHPNAAVLAAPIRSLAVLPLQNLSGDKNQEYFADGMTDELITDLGQVSALRVISRTSVMHYRQTSKTLPQIGRELGADAIVEGTVFRSGDRVRITAQLIDARNDRHLWAGEYQRDLRNVIALQDEVARDIADEVSVKLTPQERARLTASHPVNPEAHEAYLKGAYYLYQFTDAGVRKSLGFFQQAIENDPNFPLAYAALAQGYNAMGEGGLLPYAEAYSKAKASATKALQMDETLPQAHIALANALMDLDWDWAGAEREYKRTLELNPNSANAHGGYAFYLMKMGRGQEAIAQMKRAVELDPLQPGRYYALAYAYYSAHDYDQGLEEVQRIHELEPNSRPLWVDADLQAAKGRYKEAIAEFKKLAGNGPIPPHILGHLGNAYARVGMTAEARNCLRELKEDLKKDSSVGTYEVALIYVGLREKDQAFEWLDKAYEKRDKGMTYIKLDPPLDSLRSDPRFQALLRRMNFPE